MVSGTHSYSGIGGLNDFGQVVDTSERPLTLSTNSPLFAIRIMLQMFRNNLRT